MFSLHARAWPAFWTTGRNAWHGSDPELRTETAWGLTRELISRDGVDRALPAARELIDAGYARALPGVGPRADAVAKALWRSTSIPRPTVI